MEATVETIEKTQPDNNVFEDVVENEEKKDTSEKSVDHPIPDIGRPVPKFA